MSLDGKVVLVTGAARGIGRACAEAAHAGGAHVALLDQSGQVREAAKSLLTAGQNVAWAQADVGDPEQVRHALDSLVAELGPVDCLINNAGIVGNIAPLAKMAQEAWLRELNVNLTGAFNMIRAVIGPMIERRWGRIVNMSSIAARGGLHNQAGYAATKAGLLGLTRNVTIEYARHGVTCNAVLPGLIATETVLGMPAAIIEHMCEVTPARRLGTPREVADLVAFLCTERAGFINGAEIDIDGGAKLNSVALGSRKENRL